jgi:hypothetical protein
VIVITDDDFRYALISVSVLPDTTYASMVMDDIAWLDFWQIHGEDIASLPTDRFETIVPRISMRGKQDGRDNPRSSENANPCRFIDY